MKQSLIVAATFASTAIASYHGNVNYHSPSRRHPSLGIDIPKVKHAKRGLEARAWDPSKLNFTHGVASGDPYPDSVILWTRISPVLENDRSNTTVEANAPLYNHDTESYIKASPNPVCVEYQVANDKNFSTVVNKGTAYTTSDIDYTVKVEAKNLQPFTVYYYQFAVCGSANKSPVGRTKTSPGPEDDVSSIGLAVYSCSNYPNGYFNAYGNAARKDNVDYVLHLGDYIYETGKGTLGKHPRATNPKGEIFTLYGSYYLAPSKYKTKFPQIIGPGSRNIERTWIFSSRIASFHGYRYGMTTRYQITATVTAHPDSTIPKTRSTNTAYLWISAR